MKSPFVWGKGGRAMTPEDVERERELVALARAKMGDTSPVGHWTQGATRVVDALGAVLREKRTNKAEAAGLASADEAIAALLAGRGGAGYAAPSFTASSSGAPAPAAAPQGPEYPIGVDALPQSPTTPGGYSLGTELPAGVDPALAAKYAIPEEVKNGIFAGESGGDYDALFGFQNRPGGKFQNVKLTDMTIDEALNFAAPSGEYGQTVKGQIGRVATPMGAYQIVGTTLKAAKDGLGLTGNEVMTPELQDALGGWILANQGTGAWEGYKGPRDGYTPASGGPATFSGAGGAPTIPGGSGGIDIASLLALQKNPWVAKKYGGVVDALMGQQFSRQNALWEQQQKMADPMYQAQLAELTAPKVSDYDARAAAAAQYGLQPGTPEYQRFVLAGDVAVPGGANLPAGVQELQWRAEQAGLVPGTPEYQSFIINGGGDPAAYRALEMQAINAGLVKGTPEFQQFMATRGAGQAAYAGQAGENAANIETGGAAAGAVAAGKVQGEAAANAAFAAPADIAVADRTLGYIDEVRNHPGKAQGTGMSSYGNWIPGTSGKDFQNRVDQLKSGAFLSAIDELRGMGSLSNAEGQTATAAITRMDTSTSEEEFNAALDDYEAIVKLGRDRAAKRLKAPEDAAAPDAVPKAGLPTGPVTITNDAEYDALLPGTVFVGPDGKTRVKQ